MKSPLVRLELSEDQALVLAEFFARFDETDELQVAHPAEGRALETIAGQIEKQVVALFAPNYRELLEAARERVEQDA